MIVTTGHIIGLIAAIAAFVCAGIYSKRRVKDAADFDKGGGKGSTLLVVGGILGSLIGGQCTIGTAQLAYKFGMSGIWFSFGAAIGIVILGCGYGRKLRASGNTTIVEIVRNEYGSKSELFGVFFSCFGNLISVISNILSAAALIMAFIGLNFWVSCIISVVLMGIYVVFGGQIGAGLGGLVKTGLLIIMALCCFISILSVTHGIGPDTVLNIRISEAFERGIGTEISNGFSLIIGVISTQTYCQAIWSAKSDKVAARASLIAAAITIPVGFAGVMVGSYLRGMNIAVENTAMVYPTYLLSNINPILGGICIGALFITAVGGGGGITLGLSTTIIRNAFARINKDFLTGKKHIVSMRLCMVGILAIAVGVALSIPNTLINDLGFLSMGLRGTVLFIPMTLGLYFKGKFNPKSVTAGILVGPIGLVIFKFLAIPHVDPLATAMCLALIVSAIGMKTKKNELQ